MKSFQHFLVLVVLSSLLVPAFAQDEDKYNNYRKRDHDQLDQYESGDYLFPPKPKNNWSIGIKGGLAYLAGDVSAQAGYGGGLSIRKALGHSFSLRLEGAYGVAKGLNFNSNTGYRFHSNNTTIPQAGNNPVDVLYRVLPADNVSRRVFYNHSTQVGDVSLQAIFNLNNVNFYKEQPKFNIYLGAGIGLMAYSAKTDLLGADNNIYNFTGIPTAGTSTNLKISNRKLALDALKTLLDGNYETQGEFSGSQRTFGTSSTFTVKPSVSGILGIQYRVNRRVEIALEHRMMYTGDDLLDGVMWSEQGTGLPGVRSAPTQSNDLYNMTTLGINFRLGKSSDGLWWVNPLTEVYSATQESRQLVKKLTDDSDGDGVPDLYDKEPDTPEGAMVDGQGRTMDSDGDGIADFEDDEPYSPKGTEVDGSGRAIDRDNDGVPDIFDKEPNSPAGMYYDAKGVAIVIPKAGNDGNDGKAPCLLPILHFDLDKDNIKPEFFPELYYIAQVMKAEPSLRVKAIGYADNRSSDAYNLDLSRRRVTNAVDFISNTYGIDKTRFIAEYKGETDPLINNLPDNHSNRKLEPLYYVNRRVEFECVK